MIVIRVELWPGGDASRAEDLGTAHIANESSLADTSTYSVRLLKGKRYSSRPGGVWRTGEVRGYPRTSTQIGPWELLYMGLKSALGSRINRVETLCAEGEQRAVTSGVEIAPEPTYEYAIVSSDDPDLYCSYIHQSPDLDYLLTWSMADRESPIYIIHRRDRIKLLYIWDGEEWIAL